MSLVLIFLGLLLSAFFSGVETAMVSANRMRLTHRAEEGDAAARRALAFLEDPQRLLSTTLVGNNLAGVLIATLATLEASRRYGEGSVPLVVLILAAIVLVVGEILPKSLARAHADVLVPRFIAPMEAAYVAFRPVVHLVNGATVFLLRLLGARGRPGPAMLSRQDFQLLLDESEDAGQVAPAQGRILARVLDFGETTVGEVMRPRTEIVGVETGTPVRAVIELARGSGFSRIPVYRDDLDQILGTVHIFDLIRAPSADLPVDGLVRPVSFVPEAKKCDELLREMQRREKPLVVVVDEYGGTAGLVSIEDLVEELVGEIRNEDERTAPSIRRLDGLRWAVDGAVRIEEVNEALDVELPEGDYETIAGLVLDRLGRVPQKGEAIVAGPVRIEVQAADSKRVLAVTVMRLSRRGQES